MKGMGSKQDMFDLRAKKGIHTKISVYKEKRKFTYSISGRFGVEFKTEL